MQGKTTLSLDILFVVPVNKHTLFRFFDANVVSQAVMERSAMKGDEHLREKCKDQTEDRGTDINPACVAAAMEATFMDRYNATLTYSDKVLH